MASQTNPNEVLPPRPRGRFVFQRFAVCMSAAALLGLVTAWLAEVAQAELGFAPLLLFPVLTGILLGMLMIGIVRVGQIGHQPTILLGTILAVAIAVVGQHYLLYRAASPRSEKFDAAQIPPALRDGFLGFLERQAEAGRPITSTYTAHGGMAWVSWTVDGLLVLIASLAIVIPVMRLPYCNVCGTWLRTIRSGRMDGLTTRTMAELADIVLETEPKSGRYRLASCRGGCSASDLVLIWEDAAGSTFTGDASLDSEARNRLMQAADAARSADSLPPDDETAAASDQ